MSERIQKLLASRGVGSRRQCESMIADGRIEVNGKIATLGDRIEEGDHVNIDGKPLKWLWESHESDNIRVLAYNKPQGEICTRDDPEGRPTVFDRLPNMRHRRWVSVGRLDINTSGLLLFTSSGELANALMHPSQEIIREYMVRVHGHPTDGQISQLLKGVKLEDGFASFETVEKQSHEKAVHSKDKTNQWYRVRLREGRKREVRRLWESIGFSVNRLIRVRFGPIVLDRQYIPGQYYTLSDSDVKTLCRAAGLSKKNNKSPIAA